MGTKEWWEMKKWVTFFIVLKEQKEKNYWVVYHFGWFDRKLRKNIKLNSLIIIIFKSNKLIFVPRDDCHFIKRYKYIVSVIPCGYIDYLSYFFWIKK